MLSALATGVEVDAPIKLPGETDAQVSFSHVGQRIQPTGLITRTGQRSWILTATAEEWLRSGDNGYLLSVLHAHTKFFGELLGEARDGMTQSDLLTVAEEKYNCSWNSLDQIHRRTAWLRSAEFATLDFNYMLHPTEAGLEWLGKLELAQPGTFKRKKTRSSEHVVEVPTVHPLVSEALDRADLDKRKHNIGYIPRSEGDAFASIRKFVAALTEETSRQAIDEFAASEFGLRPSSSAAALSAFKNAGLVEQVGFSLYRATPVGVACLLESTNLDFLRVIHAKFSFVGEMLEALEEADTPRDLAVLGRSRYGMPTESIPEVRTRLQMLRSCDLVEEVGWGRYQLLPLGRALARELPLATPADPDELHSENQGPTEGDFSDLAADLAENLRSAALDSSKPERFEKAVAEAFSFLGFDSQLLGGSGQTDVLVSANLSGDMGYSAIVDAKSSASGKIAETQINFDTLKEHRADNTADYALIVGPSFPSARNSERARSHHIGLVEVEELIAVLRQHSAAPLSLSVLREFMQGRGLVKAEVLEKAWAQEKRLFKLCDRVIRQLAEEAKNADTVTSGALSAHDLYLILRSEVESPPTPQEIESVLSFLSSSLVHAVRKVGSQYAVLEHPRITAMRLLVLASNFSPHENE
ncbi:restriction endonuclease [Streptomyces pseudovenezuelae]|uniref:Restriction endonuclease n=1 Tax=Streptomyces pseudovenezuelae TaxID=67350 RepID=A0ABZ1X3X6_9ACTN|nr:restriction endonuclease [Streptomyces pseudovenezuelae]